MISLMIDSRTEQFILIEETEWTTFYSRSLKDVLVAELEFEYDNELKNESLILLAQADTFEELEDEIEEFLL